jgi:type I restriction enzyme M protein
LTPLKTERLKLQEEINRLMFESVLTTETQSHGEEQKEKSPRLRDSVVQALSEAQSRLSTLESQISAPQSELDRLTRQFWVTKEQVKANKYDLSASRYRQVDADAVYHEKPSVTLERLARLEGVMMSEIDELKKLVSGK